MKHLSALLLTVTLSLLVVGCQSVSTPAIRGSARECAIMIRPSGVLTVFDKTIKVDQLPSMLEEAYTDSSDTIYIQIPAQRSASVDTTIGNITQALFVAGYGKVIFVTEVEVSGYAMENGKEQKPPTAQNKPPLIQPQPTILPKAPVVEAEPVAPKPKSTKSPKRLPSSL